MSMPEWILYGANGYTGGLAAREAVQRGLRPVLAGRSEAALAPLAAELGLPLRVFALDDPDAVRVGLEGMTAVLHCAGPFSETSAPMIEGCLAQRCHYLDITGEISVFAHAHGQDAAARAAEVQLIPGVGFDVVPTDCLAARLAAALPNARSLMLAFEAEGGPSPGTAKTSIEALPGGGRVRQGGRLVTVPIAWRTRSIPFSHGERMAVTIPWGDVYTAYLSTGVPDIEVYLSMPPKTIQRLRWLRLLRPVLGLAPVQALLKRRVGQRVKGPGGQRLEDSRSFIYGEIVDAEGDRRAAEMITPNGYRLTVDASLKAVKRVLEEPHVGGYYTPSQRFGADFIDSLDGVRFDWR